MNKQLKTDIDNQKPLKKRITVSVVAQLISQVAAGLMGVFILKLMTNDLGIEQYGTYVTIFTFVSTFALLTDLGINSITMREVAKHPENAASIISHNLGLRIGLCLITIPFISGLGFVFYPEASRELRFGILLMSVYLLLDVLWSVSSAYFNAKVRSEIPAKNAIIQQVLFLIGVVLVGFTGWKLFGYIAAYIISVAIGAVIIFLKVRKHVDARPRANFLLWKRIIASSITLGVITIINTLYYKADSLIISVMIGPIAVGVYGVAYLLANVFSSLPIYIMSALTPSLAIADKAEFESIVQKAFHFMAVFSCILVVGCFLLREDVVMLVSSKEFISAATPFAVLSLAIAFSYFSRVASSACIAADKHHRFVFLSITSLILNIVLNILVIPHYGITGAAWATVATEFIALIVGYYILRHQTGVRYKLSVIIRPASAAVISLLIGLLLAKYLHTNIPLINCLVVGIGVTLPYFAILYIIKGLPDEMRDAIKKIINPFQAAIVSKQ